MPTKEINFSTNGREETWKFFLQETPIFFYSKLKVFTLLVEELTPIFNVHGT